MAVERCVSEEEREAAEQSLASKVKAIAALDYEASEQNTNRCRKGAESNAFSPVPPQPAPRSEGMTLTR